MESQKHQLPQWRRWILIAGLAGLVALSLLLLPAMADPKQLQQEGWEIIFSDDFESAFPGPWTVLDNDPSDGREYYWGNEIITETNHSVWCVGGGTDGRGLDPDTDNYTNTVDSWLIYGPIDLSRVFDAYVEFDWWLDAAPPTSTLGLEDTELFQRTGTAPQEGDWLGWCVTTDPENLEASCAGTYVSGRVGEWLNGNLSLKPYAFDDPQVWIAFHFLSDDDDEVGKGAFLDNIALSVNHGQTVALPIMRRDASPTPTSTPTPTPTPPGLYYIDHFDDPESGWTTHDAACCLPGGFCDEPQHHAKYKYELYYSGGEYHTYIPINCLEGGNHGWTRHIYPISFAPGILRPREHTCIEMQGGFENLNTHASRFGLVFAANSDMSTHYSVLVDDRGDWAIIKTTGYDFPGPNHSYLFETREPIVRWAGGPRSPVRPAMELNTLRAEITNNQVMIYINGYHVYTFSRSDITSLRYVGILGGSWEWGDTQIGYDYFYVDEGCDNH